MTIFTLSRVAVLLPLIALLLGLPSVGHGRETGKRLEGEAAVLIDLTGPEASLGRPAMNGFVLALQEAPIQTESTLFATFLNTKTDPATTLLAAQSVIPRVVVAAGFTDNDSVLLTGRLFQEANIPFLSIGATDPSLPDVIGNHIFLTPFGDNTQAAAAAEFAMKELGSTVAILFDSTSQYTRTLPRYFQTRFEDLGGHVRLNAAYAGGCDIAALGEQVRALSPQPLVVYLAGLPECIGDVVASLRAVGVTQPIIGGDGLDTPKLLRGPEGSTDGVWYTTHAWLSAETGTPTAQQFIAAYEEAYGCPPEDAFAALGYDAGNLLLQVVQQTKKGWRRDILDALEHTQDFQGVTGTISYTK
ncbi:MAG: ABC transporter substrate-binding protein, partial [Nitrospirales bacterium]